jgi:putative ABC transport system substrate-binding protein
MQDHHLPGRQKSLATHGRTIHWVITGPWAQQGNCVERREQLIELADRHAIPAIYPSRVFTDLGGLLSYGSGLKDLFQRAGIYVGKILKGARTADLPIQRNTKSEMVINLKTAKTLDLTLPSQLLALADEVIE